VSAQERIDAAVPVITNGINGAMDADKALRWALRLLDPNSTRHDHAPDEKCWRGCPAQR
jgi:hypothetical protein